MSTINPAAAAARENARAANGQFGNQSHSSPVAGDAPYVLEGCSREQEQQLEAQYRKAASVADEYARALLDRGLSSEDRHMLIAALHQRRQECEALSQQLAWYRRRDPRTVAVPPEPAWRG